MKEHVLFVSKILAVVSCGLWTYCCMSYGFASTAGNTNPGSSIYPNGGMQRMDALQFQSADENPWSALIDEANGSAYFGMGTSPGRVIKINLGTERTAPTYSTTRILNSGENALKCGVIDKINRLAYFGTDTSNPGRVVKLDIGLSHLPRVSSIELTLGNNFPRSAVIDEVNGYAYFGTNTSPSRIAKVDIAPTRTFSEKSRLELTAESNLLCGVIDAPNGYAWFGSYTSPGKIVKIALGSGSAAPTRVGAVTLASGENSLRSAVIDVNRRYAYFGTDTSPGKIIKVALGSGNNPPQRIGTLTLATGEDKLFSAMIDPESNIAWFGTATTSGKVIKVHLGEGDALPEKMGTLTLNTQEAELFCVAGDPNTGYAHFGAHKQSTFNARVVRVALSQKSFIKGTRFTMPETNMVQSVSFYSHKSVGNVRLALYSSGNTPVLLWQSGIVSNTAENTWLTVPISAGTPTSLQLVTGNYYIAWQVDTNASVPGYTQGLINDGFYVPYLWNNFPATLTGMYAPVFSNERWGVYITYGLQGEGEQEGEGENPGEGEIGNEGEGETSLEGEQEGESAGEGEGENGSEGEQEGEGENTVEGEVEGENEGEQEGETEGENEGEFPGNFELRYGGRNPVAALVGTRVEITVEPLHGIGMIEYSWYCSKPQNKFEPIIGAESNTLVFDPIAPEDTGDYKCFAVDALGAIAESPVIHIVVYMGLNLNSVVIVVILTVLMGSTVFVGRRFDKEASRDSRRY